MGGPTIQADMATVRSEGATVARPNLQTIGLRCQATTDDLVLIFAAITVPTTCLGSNYCIAAVNSTGVGAVMCSSGSTSVADNALTLHCTNLPLNQFGLFFYGPNQILLPFGNG